MGEAGKRLGCGVAVRAWGGLRGSRGGCEVRRVALRVGGWLREAWGDCEGRGVAGISIEGNGFGGVRGRKLLHGFGHVSESCRNDMDMLTCVFNTIPWHNWQGCKLWHGTCEHRDRHVCMPAAAA